MQRHVLLQLTGTVNQKRNYGSQKARIVHVGLSQSYGLWWSRSLFLFWQHVLSTCWVLQPEWHFHHGASYAKVWDSVTISTFLSVISPLLFSSLLVLCSASFLWLWWNNLTKPGMSGGHTPWNPSIRAETSRFLSLRPAPSKSEFWAS